MSAPHTPDNDERMLAALAHASVLANVVNLAGMVATLLIWVTQRERSRFVRAHAVQALAFQGAVFVALVLMLATWGGCLALALLPAALRPDLYVEGGPPAAFWVVLASFVIIVAVSGAAIAYGLFGAYRVYRGQPFRYALVGRLVRQELAALSQSAPAVPIAPLVMPPALTPQAAASEMAQSESAAQPAAAHTDGEARDD